MGKGRLRRASGDFVPGSGLGELRRGIGAVITAGRVGGRTEGRLRGNGHWRAEGRRVRRRGVFDVAPLKTISGAGVENTAVMAGGWGVEAPRKRRPHWEERNQQRTLLYYISPSMHLGWVTSHPSTLPPPPSPGQLAVV